jgi:uncharacterized membrane protein YqjE
MSAAYDERRTDRPPERPVSELVSDALQQFSRLSRSEVALARAEVSEKARNAMRGGMMLGIAAAVALPSLFILMMALAALLIELGLAASLSYLITAVIGMVIAGIVAKVGLNQLKADALMPNRTINQLHRDAQTVREHV